MSSELKAPYRLVAAFLLGMAIVHGVEFWQQRGPILAGYGDFSSFYTSGLILRQGEGRLFYDSREQWKLQQQFAPNVAIRQGPMPFIRPPFEAIVFLPLAFFSYPAAFGIWTFAKIILLWISLRVVPRPFPFARIYPYWLEAALCLGFFPVFLDLFQGQDSILLLLIVSLALNQLHSGKDVVAGAILALGLFKFHLLLPIAIILWLAGRPRILVGLIPGAAALVGISCALSGASVLSTYPTYLFRLNQTPGMGFVTVQSMPNLRGVLSAFVGRSPNPGPIQWLLFAAAVVAIVLTVLVWRPLINRGFQGLGLGYFLTLLVAIVTSYYNRVYDMSLLVIPLFLLTGFLNQQADQQLLARRHRVMIGTGLLLLICTPLYWLLILQCDCPYLLVVPMFILATGITGVMKRCERVVSSELS
jgi:hypothetical protein